METPQADEEAEEAGRPNGWQTMCGAKTRNGRRCRKPCVFGRTRCRNHGGASPIGIASPHWKHGRLSKHLPGHLLQAASEAHADSSLLSLRSEIAVLDAREVELAKRLKDNPLPDHNDILRKLKAFKNAPAGFELEAFQALEESVRVSRCAARAYEATWRELQDTMERRGRLCGMELKHLEMTGQALTKEQAGLLVSHLVEAVRSAVLSPDTFARGPQAVLTAIQASLSRVLGTVERRQLPPP
jgi:hypothetical protein